jgi:DNA-directed RNA polymerase specialized sigma24 family protein
VSTEQRAASETDTLYARVRERDKVAFGQWMGRVERPIRASLARFARAVDVEAIVQETLLRMWIVATEGLRDLQGPDASLRFAVGMARNLARAEARRNGRLQFLPPEDLPEVSRDPEPVPDPGLAAAIRDCVANLSPKLRTVLNERVYGGPFHPDRVLADRLQMRLNTFLQSVVRGRAQIRTCLEKKGVPAWEIRS